MLRPHSPCPPCLGSQTHSSAFGGPLRGENPCETKPILRLRIAGTTPGNWHPPAAELSDCGLRTEQSGGGTPARACRPEGRSYKPSQLSGADYAKQTQFATRHARTGGTDRAKQTQLPALAGGATPKDVVQTNPISGGQPVGARDTLYKQSQFRPGHPGIGAGVARAPEPQGTDRAKQSQLGLPGFVASASPACAGQALPMVHGQDAHATGAGRWPIVQNKPSWAKPIVRNKANLPLGARNWARVMGRQGLGRERLCETKPIRRPIVRNKPNSTRPAGRRGSLSRAIVRNKANFCRSGGPEGPGIRRRMPAAPVHRVS